MTGKEFLFLQQHAKPKEEQPATTITDTTKKYVYGIPGIARLFGCSIPTASRIKKTFNHCALVVAALANSTILNYYANFSADKRGILYVDTEQSPFHCQRVFKRILLLAGVSTLKQPKELKFLSLRRYAPILRLKIIEDAIYQSESLGLALIDGIPDWLFQNLWLQSPEAY